MVCCVLRIGLFLFLHEKFKSGLKRVGCEDIIGERCR